MSEMSNSGKINHIFQCRLWEDDIISSLNATGDQYGDLHFREPRLSHDDMRQGMPSVQMVLQVLCHILFAMSSQGMTRLG